MAWRQKMNVSLPNSVVYELYKKHVYFLDELDAYKQTLNYHLKSDEHSDHQIIENRKHLKIIRETEEKYNIAYQKSMDNEEEIEKLKKKIEKLKKKVAAKSPQRKTRWQTDYDLIKISSHHWVHRWSSV